jgi:general secretion pathway protein G
MARRRQLERTVFLPWERQGSWLRRLGLSPARPVFFALLAAMVFGLLLVRERKRSGIRSTKATLLSVRTIVDTYRADHEGLCPKEGWEIMVRDGYLSDTPKDAWGRPLRFICPGRRKGRAYELFSDGPDGIPGGLDRIE